MNDLPKTVATHKHGNLKITLVTCGESIEDVILGMECVLRGAGFVFDGHLTIESDEADNRPYIGDDGDAEVLCEHGVGHSEEVHTCDNEKCCKKAIKKLKHITKQN